MFFTLLSDRSVLHLQGEDAPEFLQGLVSNDVRPLSEGRAIYAAMLTPQGKFLYDFFLAPQGDAILLDCAASRADDLYKRLNFYKLRSKVVIEKWDELRVVALWGQGAAPAGFPDPRVTQMGWRMIGSETGIAQLPGEKTTQESYEAWRLEQGVPDGARDMVADKSLLLEFGFEDLHGVDFAKGCYVGQEVTARSKYRGQVRKFIYRVQGAGDLPAPGTPVYRDETVAGELRSSLGGVGIALLRVEEAQAPGAFRCGDVALEVTLPPWAAHPPALAEETK